MHEDAFLIAIQMNFLKTFNSKQKKRVYIFSVVLCVLYM
jgi:hypothetical protein